MTVSCDVAVLGAGIAGLVAARELDAAASRVVVLEARRRPGGRVRTRHGRPPLELGAEFLPPDGPAADELRRIGAKLAPVPDTHGRVGDREWIPLEFEGALDAIDDAATIADRTGDMPLAAALRASGAEPGAIRLATRYVEQYHAAPADAVSTAWVARMEGTTEGGGGGDEVQAVGGLDVLPRHLADGLPGAALRYGARVRSLERHGGSVRVTFDDIRGGPDATIIARRVLVTFPPPLIASLLGPGVLPSSHRQALGHLRMGDVVKVGLRFRREVPLPPGPRHDHPTFLHAEAPFPTWWNTSAGAPALVAWAGGPAAAALTGLGREALVRKAIAQLADMAGRSTSAVADEVVGVAWRHWSRDVLARGAYAHATVGGVGAADVLASPVDDTIFFAGEAVSEAMGTVDGAWNSALHAARQMLTGGG